MIPRFKLFTSPVQARKLPGAARGVEFRRIDVTQYMGLPEALADQ